MDDTGGKVCWELIFGYMHCIGRTVYSAGFVRFESDALRWVETQREKGRAAVPAQDPIRWCPVRHCHMKFQKPWFGCRFDGEGEGIQAK